MRKLFCFIAVLLSSVGPGLAASGVDPEMIVYRDWKQAKPNVVTIISGKKKRLYMVNFYSPYNVVWSDQERKVVDIQSNTLCALINRAKEGRCQGVASPQILVGEIYLGDAAGFKVGATSNDVMIGQASLANIPPGAKRVLHLRVAQFYRDPPVNEVVAIAFDDVSDDVLRQIAYEDGVLRVLRFRED